MLLKGNYNVHIKHCVENLFLLFGKYLNNC